MVGCITGRPAPELDFFGYRDVQIWNRDANGRLNGDEGFDRKNPYCFCFDHRSAFDPRAEVDTELVNSGHARACEVYASLLQKPKESSPEEVPVPLPQRSMTHYPGLLSCEEGCWCGYWERKKEASGGGAAAAGGDGSPLPQRTMTEHPEAYARGVPRSVWFPSPSPDAPGCSELCSRAECWCDTLSRTQKMSVGKMLVPPLPPRERDVMNEMPAERLRNDLHHHLSDLEQELIVAMDKKRECHLEGEEREKYIAECEAEEDDLVQRIAAVKCILRRA
jgi:hypothetical protein